MNKQEAKTEKLNRVGRQLLESTRIQDEEIERILAAPQLFNLVKARIEEQKIKQTKSVFFAVLNWQKRRLSFGSAALLPVVIMVLLSVFAGWNSSLNFEAAKMSVPENQLVSSEDEGLFASLGLAEPETPNLAKRSGLTKLPKPLLKSKQQPLPKVVEEEQEFYPLTFVGDLEDMQADAQIVRVELPRSSLIALGVNPPAENAAEKIKTEFLIGSDVVTRGIRFLK
jgi:hypothetical protein